jgi:site-specific DNA-methyltransferase (adenine-specific)
MRQIVADYSAPGDLICDPFAGMATTLLAASAEGRRAVGAEMDPETHRLALARLTLDDGRQAVLPGVDAVREVEP